MRWDWVLLIAGMVLIVLWGVLRIQRERYAEAEQRRKRAQVARGRSSGLRRPRRRQWADRDRL